MQMPPVEEGAPERSSSEQGGFAGCPAARRSGEPHALKASACTLRESKGTKMPPNGCLCVEKARGGGMGQVPTGCVAAAGNSMRKNRSPPPTPEPILQNAKTHLSKALERQLAVFSVPDKAPQGFSVPQQRRNGSTPPPTYPGDGMGMDIACLPLTQGSPQSPKTKNTTEQTNKNKNKKHCYHQLI